MAATPRTTHTPAKAAAALLLAAALLFISGSRTTAVTSGELRLAGASRAARTVSPLVKGLCPVSSTSTGPYRSCSSSSYAIRKNNNRHLQTQQTPRRTNFHVVHAGFGSTADAPDKAAAPKKSQDLDTMKILLPKLGQAKCYGVDPRDYIEQPPIESKVAITIDALSKKLEENFAGRGGYSVSEWRDALAGEWQLLFTTSQSYRDNRGVTGYSGLPGYGLKAIYQRIMPVEDDADIDGKAILIEVLTAPFGKASKNELRGAYKVYSKNDKQKKKQVALDQSFVTGDTGGEYGKDIKANLMQYNTYVTKDAKLRFGRSPTGALFIWGRIGGEGDGTEGGINEILSQDRLPWDGGSPLFRVF